METKQIEELADAIDKKIEGYAAKAATASDEVKAQMKADIKEMTDQFNKITADMLEVQKSVDQIAAEGKRIKQAGEGKTLESVLEKSLKDADFAAYVGKKKSGVKAEYQKGFEGLPIRTKAVPVSTATTEVVPADYRPTIIAPPDRRNHIRDFINVISTTSNRIVLPVEKTISDGFGVVPEGTLKGYGSFSLDINTFPVIKIASVHKITEEMLDDIPGLVQYITTRFMAKLANKEDSVLLYNALSASEFQGLIPAADAYVDVLADPLVSRWDILRAAITQATVDEYTPTRIFMHPTDVMLLRGVKDTSGNYIGGAAPWSPVPLQVDGVPIVSTTAINVGEFLVGDMAMGAQIFDRMTPSVRFYDQDENNAQMNLITVVVEERLTLAILRPSAFVWGTFAVGLAYGTA